MMGGDEAAQKAVRPLLASFATNIVSAGSTPGAGHALKGINNLLKLFFSGFQVAT
jgi:3-hydroxyisobutyrate dehydrogenase-like beta-hydroxyacid dehydrogenase